MWVTCPRPRKRVLWNDREADHILKTMAGPRCAGVLKLPREKRPHVQTEGMLRFEAADRSVRVGELSIPFLLLCFSAG